MIKTTTEKVIALVSIFFTLCLLAGFIIVVVAIQHDNQSAVEGGFGIMGAAIGVGGFTLLMYMIGRSI